MQLQTIAGAGLGGTAEKSVYMCNSLIYVYDYYDQGNEEQI